MARIEADVRAGQQSALLASVMGAAPEWPELDDQLEMFEAWLTAEPKTVDPEELELRQALGLRGSGG